MVGSEWRRWLVHGVGGAALVVVSIVLSVLWLGQDANAEVSERRAASSNENRQADEPSERENSPQRPAVDHRRGFDLDALTEVDGRLVQDIGDRRIITTLDPELHRFAEELLERYSVPDGAAIAINSRTGEIIAFAEHSEREPGRHVALSAESPAASIFKVVTAAALLELAGLSPDLETCYHGGSSGISAALLRPDPERDTRCASLSSALGRSINVIFARLASQHLTREQLMGVASGFGFNSTIDFDLPLEPARLELPTERLERARAAAGFWHSYISPLHAAMMAQAVAQGGAILQPHLIDEVRRGDQVLLDVSPSYIGRACSPETARQLARMMVTTTTVGTARRSFRDRHGRVVIPGVDVAGKTGTLHGHSPFRAYDWFMGFAPADDPEIAVAGLVINDPQWRIKGHYVGRELLRRYFQLQRQRER